MSLAAISGLSVLLVTAASTLAQPTVPEATPADTGRPPAPPNSASDPNATLGIEGASSSASELHLSFSPYLWLTSFSGDISVRGVSFDVNKEFVDIFDESDSTLGFMGALDLEYKGFVFQLNGSFVTVEESKTQGIFRNGTVEADVDLDASWTEFLAGYRFLDKPLSDEPESHGRFALDAFLGGRITTVDIDTTLSASTIVTLPGGGVLNPGQSTDRNQSSDWFEPFVGVRGIINLDEHWMIQVRGDVGGFGVDGSDFAWQAAAILGYQWRLDGWSLGVFGGYRALGQDHSSGDLNWDVVTHGPLLGLSFSWDF